MKLVLTDAIHAAWQSLCEADFRQRFKEAVGFDLSSEQVVLADQALPILGFRSAYERACCWYAQSQLSNPTTCLTLPDVLHSLMDKPYAQDSHQRLYQTFAGQPDYTLPLIASDQEPTLFQKYASALLEIEAHQTLPFQAAHTLVSSGAGLHGLRIATRSKEPMGSSEIELWTYREVGSNVTETAPLDWLNTALSTSIDRATPKKESKVLLNPQIGQFEVVPATSGSGSRPLSLKVLDGRKVNRDYTWPDQDKRIEGVLSLSWGWQHQTEEISHFHVAAKGQVMWTAPEVLPAWSLELSECECLVRGALSQPLLLEIDEEIFLPKGSVSGGQPLIKMEQSVPLVAVVSPVVRVGKSVFERVSAPLGQLTLSCELNIDADTQEMNCIIEVAHSELDLFWSVKHPLCGQHSGNQPLEPANKLYVWSALQHG